MDLSRIKELLKREENLPPVECDCEIDSYVEINKCFLLRKAMVKGKVTTPHLVDERGNIYTLNKAGNLVCQRKTTHA